jgi:predicted ribosomally synthesized peptide with SipW-like signal peptide
MGIAGAAAGYGTSALYTDEEEFLNNSITAGTLDMTIDASIPSDGINDEWASAIDFEGYSPETADGEPVIGVGLADIKPGDWVILCYEITVETNPACLGLTTANTANDDNGLTEPEEYEAGDTTGGDGEGELAQNLEVTVYDDLDVSALDGTLAGAESALSNELLGGVSLQDVWATFDDGNTIAAETMTFDFYLLLELPSDVGNVVQSDSVEWDFVFDAVQSRNNECDTPVWETGECETCTLPTDVSESESVQISSVEASGFPEVSTFLRVDTNAGNNGDLAATDFEVCENEFAQEETVDFSSGSAADIVFVFDDTGSMGQEIDGAQSAIVNFVQNLTDDAGIDARFALVSFKDTVEIDQDFTTSQDDIEAAINGLSASSGGDGREDNFDGIGVATRDIAADSGGMLSSYRTGAQRVIIDITDAPAQVDDPDAFDNDESRTDYVMSDVEALLDGYTYIAVSADLSETSFSDSGYSDGDKEVLADNVGGSWFELPTSDSDEFSDLLTNEVSGQLTTTYTVTYTTCNDDPEPAERNILLEINDPAEGTLYKTITYTVPS